ncbi:MAG: SMC family ATPase, partial [Clostridia bacterium]|nr:SMC family ATPase [Clostridia bacterium]
GIKAAPVCKSIAETDGEISQQTEKLKTLKESILQVKLDTDNTEKLIAELAQKSENANFDERIEKYITLSAKYTSCEGKPEKLSILKNQLESKRAEYRTKFAELSKLNGNLTAAQDRLTAAQKAFAEFGVADLDNIINVAFKGAVLKDEYVNSLDYFVGLNGQVNFFRDDSELYKFISRELKQQIETYKDRVYQVKDFSVAEAQRQLKEIQSAGEEREKLTNAVNDCKVALKDAQTAVNDCTRELKILERDGDELRKHVDEICGELNKVFGQSTDFEKAVRDNERTLKALKEEKANLSEKADGANKRLGELKALIAAKEAEEKTLSAEIEKLKEKLSKDLKQSGFDSVEGCLKLAEQFAKFADAEKALDEYDKSVISLTERKKILEGTDGIKDFSNEALKEAETYKNSVSDELTEARKSFAVLEADLKKMQARLSEKEVLLKDFTSAEKQRNLIAQLKDITKGNKFMEFIANEYLCDISALASSTLLNLTDGRYFFTYTDTFYAGDNFNCGNLRGVNTLSGGETFLVSLSLALALSQTICVFRPIEFFFLDEGFGTLDGTLVDTVMNALEKLKSSSFTIGVISHVEELKHRIDSKITVNKATESHGSTVQLSC